MATIARSAARLILVALVTLVAAPARAEDAAPPAPAGSTLQAMAEDLSSQVGRLIADMPRPRQDLVAVSVAAGSPGRGVAGGDLPRLLLDALLGSIGRREPLRSVRAGGGPGWLDEAGARSTAAAQGYELLIWLVVSIEANHVVVEGVVFDTERDLWRDAAGGEARRVVGRIFARARVDAELRRHLEPLPAGPLSVTPVPLGEGGVLALAVADLDGDDLNEVVLVSERAVEVRRLRAGQAEVMARLSLAGLPPAATRSRDPVGTMAVGPPDATGGRPVALRTSDLDQGLVVGFDGVEIGLRSGIADFPIRWAEGAPQCTTVAPGRSTFQTAAAPCGSLGETPTVPPFHALVRERLPQPGGPPAATAEGTVLADGSVALQWNGRVVARLGPFGTALAISDLDDDGVAEVLLSSDRDPGAGDELTVLRLGAAGVAAREPLGGVPGSVWVAAAGDADNDGLRELLAVAEAGAATALLVVE